MNDVQKMVADNLPFIKYCIWCAFGRRSKTPIPQFLGVATESFIRCVNVYVEGKASIRTYSRKSIIGSVRVAYWADRCIVRPPLESPVTPWIAERAERAATGWVSIFDRRPVDGRLSRSVDELTSSEPDVDAGIYISELCEALDDALRRMPKLEREVVSLRFGLYDGQSKTLDEVGKIIGRSRERVRQIEARGIRKLQQPDIVIRLIKFIE